MSGVRAIITGATGMVGEGVLHECLLSPEVEEILVINRKPCGVTHPKLKEIIHTDFFNLSMIADKLHPYNACFFCLGVSSVGMKEDQYRHLTYDLTMHVAQTLLAQNPGMTFCYISGSGTDGTEKGKTMWARVKGKTENDLMKLPFKKAFMFRPGYMQPTKGLKNTLGPYKALAWLYPLWHFLFPNFVCRLRDVGVAMINTVTKDYSTTVLEVRNIVALSKL
jgi:hypothetical protein